MRIFHAIFQRAKQLFHLREPDRRKSTYVDFLRRAQSAVESLLVFEKRHDVCLDDTVYGDTYAFFSLFALLPRAPPPKGYSFRTRRIISSRSGF